MEPKSYEEEHQLNIDTFRTSNLLKKYIQKKGLPYVILTNVPNTDNQFNIFVGDNEYVAVKCGRSLLDNKINLSFKDPYYEVWQEYERYSEGLAKLKECLLAYK